MGFFVLFGVILGVVVVIIMGIVEAIKAIPVDCPVCGKRFKLTNESSICPKCRTRIVRTKDGKLISTQ